MELISKIQYITNDTEGMSHPEQAREACIAGIDWIQLRVKDKSFEEWLEIATATKAVCEQYNARLIINDNVAIAKEINADGVHLGKKDMRPSEARTILGKNYLIGGTANNSADVLALKNEGVDYIGLGPFRFTKTKKELSPILEIDGYENIIGDCKKNNVIVPIIAIGGIKEEDVVALMEKGIYGIAVSSAISQSNDKVATIHGFKKNLGLTIEQN